MATKMEVDVSEKQNVMASAVTTGSVSVSLHPLVIMNISEHWTRVRAQNGEPTQVLGALIGKQKGRNIEVMNSFELLFTRVDGTIIIDRDYYNTKEDQFKQVFSDLDFLGWYTTGGYPSEDDIKVHKQICQINESPIFLKLLKFGPNETQSAMGSVKGLEVSADDKAKMLESKSKNGHINELPICIYESVIDLINGEATMLFVELQYTLATEEAERIGVDHVARMSTSDTGESSTVAEHLIAQHNAIKMLHNRVRLVLQYIQAVHEGKLPRNHEILREAYSLCHRLPVLNTDRFRQEFYNQCNDVSLMTYLGMLTKGCNDINQFVNKFNVLYDRQGLGRRMRGLFF